MNEILFLLTGALVGGGAAWFIRTYQLKSQMGVPREQLEAAERELAQLRQDLAGASARTEVQQERLAEVERQLSEARRALDERGAEVSTMRERNQALLEKLANQKEEIEALQKSFQEKFENLANRIFEEKSKKFAEQNKQSLDTLLMPIGERLKEFGKKVEDTYNVDTKERATLQEQIRNLTELNQKMTQEASNLTRALKGDSKAQGNWGEVILERILERSGLEKGREYRAQESFSVDGGRLQPDVIVDLPDDKHLVIDAKVSLTAYERFVSADDDEERTRAVKEHVQSLRTHIRGLSGKKYEDLYDMRSPDFVLLFVPVEPAFAVALREAPDLYNEAFEKNIVIVSPSTLLATLATINSVWKQEYRTRNAVEIARQAGDLYDKLSGFVQDLQGVGNRLTQAQGEYEKAMNKLSTGRGNVIGRAERLRKLGVKTSKELPKELVEGDAEADLDEE